MLHLLHGRGHAEIHGVVPEGALAELLMDVTESLGEGHVREHGELYAFNGVQHVHEAGVFRDDAVSDFGHDQ